MAGDWIKMQKSLPRDPRVVRISSALKADRLRTVGGLLSAWCLFDEQTEDGILEGYTPDLLDEIIGFPGLSLAMETVGWLDVHDGFLAVPNFAEHNGQSAKRRAQDSFRKMSARKTDKCPQTKRTKSGLEKNREEKSIIPPNPQGGFGLDNPESTPKNPKRSKRISPAQKRIAKIAANTPTMDRIGSWFGRRESTLWTVAESEALAAISPTPAELDGMEALYTADPLPEGTFIRNSLQTLLNNWPGELDKARGFARKHRGAA